MSSITQYKKEKKIIEEKMQKVRQVVPTASNNQIILALHNYDLDVERTIQAFLEEGAQGALGDWESTAKPKKSKKKNQKATDSSTSSVVEAATTGTVKQQQQQNGKSSTSTSNYTNGYTNCIAGNLPPTPTVSASSSAVKPKQAPKITTSSNLDNLDRLNSVDKSKVLSDEVNALNRHQTDLNKIQKQFHGEISNAETSIAQCFKEIRQITAEREQQLISALTRVRDEGNHYVSSRQAELRHLQSTAKDSPINEDSMVAEFKRFLANKQHDLELGHVTRFVYDNSKLVNSIARFGEIVAINGSSVVTNPVVTSTASHSNEIKHATSHSSLVSSVGEDSGLGQISPVSNEKNNIVQVESSGIKMQSSGISADQLAEIQRQLAEQLKAQGIDPSVLAGASAAPPPSVRRQRQQGNAGNKRQNNKKNTKPSIELSILN